MSRAERGVARTSTRQRRLVGAAAVAALAVAGLVAFGTDSPGGGPAGDRAARSPVIDQGGLARSGVAPRAGTAAAMLARRGSALVAKDRQAFLATVDPTNAALREQQARLFDNLADVPLAEWSYDLPARADDALPAKVRDRVAELGGSTFASIVGVGVRIKGLDHDPAEHEEVLAFTSRDGRWFVSARFAAPGRGNSQLWDAGKVHVLATRHALVLGLEPADLAPIAEEVDLAVPKVDAVWGKDWARQVLVLVTRTEEEMAVLLGGKPSAYRQLAAITRGELGAAEGTGSAERVVINPLAYGELSDIGRRTIMIHEITHVAARAFTQPWTPMWLTEGFADYVGFLDSGLDVSFIAQELVADVEAGRLPSALPADIAFDSGSTRLPQAYEMAWLACKLIVDRYGGEDTLLEFFRAVGAPGGNAASIEAAFVDVLGTTEKQFTRQWREYLRSTLT